MSGYYEEKAPSSRQGTTLNSLKEELYSLNMRMLLAMQNHNQTAQDDIQSQIDAVQKEIYRMALR